MIPREAATRYFQLIFERKLTEAEKELEHLSSKSNGSEWDKGYVKALEGLFLTKKSNDDKYLYLNKVDPTKENLKSLQEEFVQHSTNELHADYDRAYFRALADYVTTILKLEPWKMPRAQETDEPQAQTATGEEAERPQA